MKKKDVPHIAYLPFDHATLVNNPKFTLDLATFFCSIWTYDPNFGEYKVCPNCEKYFNEHQVEVEHISQCSGENGSHPLTDIITAWVPEDVANNILLEKTSEYGDNFFGLYAVDKDTDKIVGFTWGWLENAEAIREKWGDTIIEKLQGNNSTYYSEIAVAPGDTYRSKGIGKTLCSMLTMWMGSSYSYTPSFLRTHKTSHAKSMFEKVGYMYFADDPQHGDGRIMMMVEKGQDLIP